MSIKRHTITASLAAAALLASTFGALAATAFATSNVNVRSGPGIDYRQVDVLRRGEGVDIDYCRGAWCFVSKSGPDGWVNANYLSRGGGRYYDDDDDFYIERPRRGYRPYYRSYRPSTSACIGGPNASFCIYD